MDMLKLSSVVILFLIMCPRSGAQIHPIKLADLPDKITESSGLYIENRNAIWTINDGGNSSILYKLDSTGKIEHKLDVEAKNHDWEDLAADKKNVYIGDFGNNLNKRKNLRILIVPKKKLDNKDYEPDKIEFSYEDQEDFPPTKDKRYFDCEAMVAMNDSLFLFMKNRSQPFDGLIHVYVVPAEEGEYVAKRVNTIETGYSSMYNGWVTSAELVHHDLFLLSTNKVFVLKNFAHNPRHPFVIRKLNISGFSQKEAIAFDGKNRIYFTDELLGPTGMNLSYFNLDLLKDKK